MLFIQTLHDLYPFQIKSPQWIETFNFLAGLLLWNIRWDTTPWFSPQSVFGVLSLFIHINWGPRCFFCLFFSKGMCYVDPLLANNCFYCIIAQSWAKLEKKVSASILFLPAVIICRMENCSIHSVCYFSELEAKSTVWWSPLISHPTYARCEKTTTLSHTVHKSAFVL